MGESAWTHAESSTLFQLLKDRRVEEFRDGKDTLRGSELWRLMAERMGGAGINRNANACKHHWESRGEEIHNFKAMESHRPGSITDITSLTDDEGIQIHIKAQKTSDIPAMNTLDTVPLQQFLDNCRNVPPPQLNPSATRPSLYLKRHIRVNLNVATFNSTHVGELSWLTAWAGTVWGDMEDISLLGGGNGFLAIIQVEDDRPSNKEPSTLAGLQSKVSGAFGEVRKACGGEISGLRVEFLGMQR